MIMFWVAVLAISILLYVLLDGFDLGVGILFGLTARRGAARRDAERRRADLGRQRDLAGRHRRRALGRLSARLCDAAVGLLPAAPSDAGGADPARRRLRVPRTGRALALDLGCRLRRRIARRRLHAGPDGRRAGRGPADRQRPVMSAAISAGSARSRCCAASASASAMRCSAPAGWCRKCEGDVRDDGLSPDPVSGDRRCSSFLVVVFVYALAEHLRVMDRWLERPYLFVFPAIGVVAAVVLAASVASARDGVPFHMVALIFAAAFGTLAISFWPYMIPFSITIDEAAAPHSSLAFMFWGEGLFVFPLMLLYAAVNYAVFRGKIRSSDEHY